MFLLSAFALVLFYIVHPAFFWGFLILLVLTALWGMVQTARALDDVHGGICRACVLAKEDFYSDIHHAPDKTVYTVRLCYRDGTSRRVTLRENDTVLRALRRRGMLCDA